MLMPEGSGACAERQIVFREKGPHMSKLAHSNEKTMAEIEAKYWDAQDEPHQTRAKSDSSVECPHCHWGFAPSVIQQHIREKH
jgi:hypothetical protein